MLRREILVFTEGLRTEDGYLLYWRRRHRDTVLVTVDSFHGVPYSLVERAIEVKKDQAREERRGRGRAHDELWCVFDRDEHPQVAEAIARAAAAGIGVVMSNPCVELWFILHHADQVAHIDRSDAQRRARELLCCDKILTPDALSGLIDRYPDAKRRATKLDEKHLNDGSPPRTNPSSNMWELIDRIRNAAAP